MSPSRQHLYPRSADHEAPAGLQVVDGVLVQVLGGDHGLDDLLLQDLPLLLQAHAIVVLHRDHHSVDPLGDHSAALLDILDRHLGRTTFSTNGWFLDLRRLSLPLYLCFGVWTQPGDAPVTSQFGHLGIELVGEDDRERHALLCLIGGVSKH